MTVKWVVERLSAYDDRVVGLLFSCNMYYDKQMLMMDHRCAISISKLMADQQQSPFDSIVCECGMCV